MDEPESGGAAARAAICINGEVGMGNSNKALIIGAGIGGLTAAIALQRIGVEPVVYERAPKNKENGTTLVLWPNALRVLRKLDLAEEVIRAGFRNRKLSIFTSNGVPLYELMFHDLEKKYGYPVTTVLRADLQRLMLERLGAEHVVWGKELNRLEQDGRQVAAYFADGHVDAGQFMIGADGIHSTVHRIIAGEARLRYCGYAAYRGMIAYEPESFQAFGGTEVWGEGKRFGFSPSGRNTLYWFAAVNSAEEESSARGGRKEWLLDAFAGWGRPVEPILTQSDESAILRHPIYDLPSIPYWTKGRVALLGDAAHAMTPNLGQGACQAIEDGGALGDCIEQDSSVERALRRYEAVRAPRVRRIVRQSHLMGKVTQWSRPGLCRLRNSAFASIPNAWKLKQLERMLDK